MANTFYQFLFEQEIYGLVIATMTALAINSLTKDIKRFLFEPFLKNIFKQFKLRNIGLISSFLEFILIMFMIYLIYKLVMLPLFKKDIEKQKREKEQQQQWRENILREIKSLDIGNVYM